MEKMIMSAKGRIARCLFVSFLFLGVIFYLPLQAVAEGAKPSKSATRTEREKELTKLVEAAKAEGKVIWRDGMKMEESGPMIRAFEKKYPFIKVDHARTRGNDWWERLLRELMAGKVDYDVIDLGGEVTADFIKAGLLEKYDWTKAFDIRPEQLDRSQMFVYVGASVKGIGYNTNKVSQKDLPKTWEDLLDPKWKGKIVLDTRPKTFLHLMPAWGEERVYAYLKKLVANKPIFRRGQSETIELMASGEIAMIAGTYIHRVTLMKRKGAPVDALLLDPVPTGLEDEAVLKGAPHPNAAKLLLGWLAKEGQKLYDEATDRGIPLAGFDTQSARMVKGKNLSLFTQEWIDREPVLEAKALKAMGRD